MTSADFIKKAKLAAESKTLYVMGCFGAPMNGVNKAYYTSNYPYNKQEARRQMILAASADTFGFDCICLIKGILWGWNADSSAKYGGASYASRGVPDCTEAMMINLCSDVSGSFKNIVPGEMLYMQGHAGIYIGGGLAIESTPIWKNGVQVTAVKNIGEPAGYNARKWEKHGKLPWIKYTEEPVPIKSDYIFGFNMQKYGSFNEDVELIQDILNGCGYKDRYGNKLELDGEFGDNTLYCVKKFQENMKLEADGIVGQQTWTKLLNR